MNYNSLQYITQVLKSECNNIKQDVNLTKDCLWALSNILLHQSLYQSILKENTLELVLNLLLDNNKYDIINEGLNCLHSLFSSYDLNVLSLFCQFEIISAVNHILISVTEPFLIKKALKVVVEVINKIKGRENYVGNEYYLQLVNDCMREICGKLLGKYENKDENPYLEIKKLSFFIYDFLS